MRTSAFISYSHVDSKWLERLQIMLAPLSHHGLDLWSDEKIKPGELWKDKIETALSEAKVAILLVSPSFLQSDFIAKHELPSLLHSAEKQGLKILWIPIEESMVHITPVGKYQALCRADQPLSSLPKAKANKTLREIGDTIAKLIESDVGAKNPTEYKGDSIGSASPDSEAQQVSDTKRTVVMLRGYPYLVRENDEDKCIAAIQKPGNLIRIKSPEKMGKSTLMARLMDHAKRSGYRTAVVNLRDEIDQSVFHQPDSSELLETLCSIIWDQLGADSTVAVKDFWKSSLTPIRNCFNFLANTILGASEQPLVLAIDNLDNIFTHKLIMTDVLGLLRGCYEKANSSDQFQKLRQVIVYSQEAYGIQDIQQSPLNIGEPIVLGEFSIDEVSTLADAYGLTSWSHRDSDQLMDMVGGHPYLIQQSLSMISNQHLQLKEFLQAATASDGGPFRQHLYESLLNLEANIELYETMKKIVFEAEALKLGPKQTFKLEGMGLIRKKSMGYACRCNLYQIYFADKMR